MPDSLLKAPTFNNVAAGGVAVCDLPRDRRYHTIFVKATATGSTDAATVVQEINLTINGKSQRRLTVAQLRAINAYNGATYNGSDANTLVIHLREPWLTDPRDQHALSWGMGGVSSFRVEVTLKSGDRVTLNGASLNVTRGVAQPPNHPHKRDKHEQETAHEGGPDQGHP